MKRLAILIFFIFVSIVLSQENGSQSGTTPINFTIVQRCGDGTCDFNETCSNCPADCGVCPTPGPGPGPGPGPVINVTNKTTSNYSFSLSLYNVTQFIPVYIEIPPEKNLTIIAIIIETTMNVPSLNLTIERLLEKPSFVNTSSDNDYTYLNITASTANIFRVKFKFRIERPWFAAENIQNTSQIAMYRMGGNNWEKLTTFKIYEDTNYHYYYSESQGLGIFSIGTTKEEGGVIPIQPKCPTCPTDFESACIDGNKTVVTYYCGNETDYQCASKTEISDCEIQPTLDYTKIFMIAGAAIGVIFIVFGVYLAKSRGVFAGIGKMRPSVSIPEVSVTQRVEKLSIEEVIDSANPEVTVFVKGNMELHAMGSPNIYKIEDETGIIYATSTNLIDRGEYIIEGVVKKEGNNKYLDVREVNNV